MTSEKEESPEQSLSAWGNKETEYFYSLTPDKILTAVERFGFRCTGRCLALNSMENRVYDVEIDIDDDSIRPNAAERFKIVKFYRPGRWTKEQILEEHEFLLDLVKLEIPVVAPMQLDDGSTLIELPDSKIYCALFPKVGGRNPQELSDEQLPLIGRLLARLHNVGALKESQHRIEITPDTYGLQSLDYLLDNEVIPERMENHFEDVVESICELSRNDFENAAYHRIHGDCHFGNLLWGPQGPFWVDFDDMLHGPAIQDIWLMFPSRDEYAKEQLSKLIDAYQQMRAFDMRTLRLIEPLRSLRMIHFNAWIAKRWEDPAFQKAFVEFGTDRYWAEQMRALEEQLSIIEQMN